MWFRAPDFQDGLLGLAEVGINANPDTVDPRINLTETLDNVEAPLLEMDGCALAFANFGLATSSRPNETLMFGTNKELLLWIVGGCALAELR